MNDKKENRKKRFELAEKNRIKNVYIVTENIWYDHNISAIFRTMESLGFYNIYICGNPTKKKISHRHIDFRANKYLNIKYFDDIADAINLLKEKKIKIFSTYMTKDAKPLTKVKFFGDVAIIMGNEKDGVSDVVLENSNEKIWIPAQGLTRSLNVSVSTGILLFEVLRQKSQELNEINSEILSPFMQYPGERE